MEWLSQPCPALDLDALHQATLRQQQLTKPPGALGQLERLAIHLAGLQRRATPAVERIHITVFAADHGVAAEGVSAFPQPVTAQMVENFLQGGAAISVLAQHLGARLEVVDVGVLTVITHPRLIQQRVAAGTRNCAREAAMSSHELERAMQVGFSAAERAAASRAELFIGGEMGIGNTTPATALYCQLLNLDPTQVSGPGTGLDAAGVRHKAHVVAHILALHAEPSLSPLEALRRMGGLEIAALSAAYLRAAQRGIPVLVDGFISTAAALLALRLQPSVRPWLLLAHCSAEPGHRLALAEFAHPPLLDLGLKLGEGSGAALAVPLLQMACVLHQQMATFTEAAIAGKLV